MRCRTLQRRVERTRAWARHAVGRGLAERTGLAPRLTNEDRQPCTHASRASLRRGRRRRRLRPVRYQRRPLPSGQHDSGGGERHRCRDQRRRRRRPLGHCRRERRVSATWRRVPAPCNPMVLRRAARWLASIPPRYGIWRCTHAAVAAAATRHQATSDRGPCRPSCVGCSARTWTLIPRTRHLALEAPGLHCRPVVNPSPRIDDLRCGLRSTHRLCTEQ
jgi:hypothetical protein